MSAARLYAANGLQLGQAYELDAIAAVILGGTSFVGGIGSIWGTLVGALIIAVLTNGLILTGVSDIWQFIIKGLVIIGAVMLDRFRQTSQSAVLILLRAAHALAGARSTSRQVSGPASNNGREAAGAGTGASLRPPRGRGSRRASSKSRVCLPLSKNRFRFALDDELRVRVKVAAGMWKWARMSLVEMPRRPGTRPAGSESPDL